jgi:hypothetical protein
MPPQTWYAGSRTLDLLKSVLQNHGSAGIIVHDVSGSTAATGGTQMIKKQCPLCRDIFEASAPSCGRCRFPAAQAVLSDTLTPACLRIACIVFAMASLVAVTAKFL